MSIDSVDDLRSSIVKKLASGVLPHAAPILILTTEHAGIGLPCAACGFVIGGGDVECIADVPDHALYRFHAGCFIQWRRAAEHGETEII